MSSNRPKDQSHIPEINRIGDTLIFENDRVRV